MKRRIAISILLTVWCLLIAGGTVAYVTTRSVLLSDLDDSLVNRAAALAVSASDPNSSGPPVSARGAANYGDEGDRYLVTNDLGQTVARPFEKPGMPPPVLVAATFSEVAGAPRQRTVTVRVAAPAQGDGQTHTLTITYSAPAARLDALLTQLATALCGGGIIAGLAAAAVAWKVSGLALRPLKTTAAQIGTIDEQNLDRRIDLKKLPPELLPMGDRLNEMLRRLEEAFVRRGRFLADASHELRTPVASLATALEIALRYPQDPRQFRQTLQTCFDEAKTLRRLVDSLMEQARGEQTQRDHPTAINGPIEWIDVAALLESCLQTAGPLASEKEVKLCRQFAEPLEFPTREPVLRSIVLNLLTNAIEYNRPGGRVDLICRIEKRRTGRSLHLAVRDTGIGIAAGDLPRVFEPFFRASAARPASGHMGLGLALVQTNVRALGGVCSVESSRDGTTFRFDLPCDENERPEAKPMTEEPAEQLAGMAGL